MVTKKSAKTVKTSPGAEKVDLAGNETKLRDIVIDAVEYVSCDDVMKMAPVYAKGYRNTRELVKKKGIACDTFVYARECNGKWALSDNKSIRHDKVLLKKSYLVNIPECVAKNDANVVVVDDKGIKKAPPIIELDDAEKFRDDAGNVMDIETRGKRECDGIFFKVKNVSEGFALDDNLHRALTLDHGGYIESVDYTYFICEKKGRRSEKNKERAISYISRYAPSPLRHQVRQNKKIHQMGYRNIVYHSNGHHKTKKNIGVKHNGSAS